MGNIAHAGYTILIVHKEISAIKFALMPFGI